MKKILFILLLMTTLVTLVACLPADERHLAKANQLYDEEKFAEAIEECTTAIDINPELKNAYMTRAAAYTETGQYSSALDDLNKVIEMDPEHTMAYYQRSMTYIFSGNFDGAIDDCNTVISMGLENHLVYYNRGIAYAKKGDYNFALADLLKARSLTSNTEFYARVTREINELEELMN